MEKKYSLPPIPRAALYIRLSREDERQGPSQSIVNQKAMLEEFAARQGFAVEGIYTDDGYSGTNFERPGFSRMLAGIEAGRIDTVITKDLSRLGRDYILTGYYLERYFPEHRVRYISLLDGIDSAKDSHANEITPFRAILNDMYAKDISKKIRSVKDSRRRQGFFIGGKAPFGYILDSETRSFRIDTTAAAYVREIFSLAQRGLACAAAARELNRRGIPTPGMYAGGTQASHAGWTSAQVRSILVNPVYLGHMVQGKSERISYKSKRCRRRDPERWMIVENTHEAIVDGETFAEVQRLIGSRKRTRMRRYDAPLKGKLLCADCGHPLSLVMRRTKAGEERLYYLCRRGEKSGASCASRCIREETVQKVLRDAVSQLVPELFDPASFRKFADPWLRDFWVQHRSRHTDSDAALSRLDSLIDLLFQKYSDGVVAEEDFARLYQSYQQKRREMQRALGQSRAAAPTLPLIELKDFPDWLFGSRPFWEALSDRIEVSETKDITVYLRIKDPFVP